MSSVTLTLPLLPGKYEAWRRFCQEMQGGRQEAYEMSRHCSGITAERLALVETAVGSAVLLTLEAREMGEALSQLASSDAPFDHWFRQKLVELHGFTLVETESTRLSAPQPEIGKTIFEWQVSEKGKITHGSR